MSCRWLDVESSIDNIDAELELAIDDAFGHNEGTNLQLQKRVIFEDDIEPLEINHDDISCNVFWQPDGNDSEDLNLIMTKMTISFLRRLINSRENAKLQPHSYDFLLTRGFTQLIQFLQPFYEWINGKLSFLQLIFLILFTPPDLLIF